MSEKAKVGFIVDDYKIDKYKKTLKEKGFEDYEITPKPFMKKVSIITVEVSPENVGSLHQMVKANELYFKRQRRNRRY